MKLNAAQIRNLEEGTDLPILKRQPIYLIVDNVYDTYNVGGLFRLSDGLCIEKIYLCGTTETPPNHKIKKASIGTYKIVPWEYFPSTVDAIRELRKNVLGIRIYSIEQSETSIPYTTADFTTPIAFIVGNETSGITQDVMKASDATLEIPMFGLNKSLNVIVSAAIVMFYSITRIKAESERSETPKSE